MADKKKLFIPPNAHLIWVDGSFRPPDNASCAYLIFSAKSKHVVDIRRFAFRGSTINQMELQAVNKALDYPSEYAVIYSDSTYVIGCFTLWIKNWKRNNWVDSNGNPVKNQELIKEIQAKIERRKFVRFVKVKAHTGDPFNSLVDYMAQELSFRMTKDAGISYLEETI